MVLGLAALGVSLVIAVVVVVGFSAPVELFPGIPFPLAVGGAWGLSLVGYLLTPLLSIGCYGWDAIAQRSGQRRDVNFSTSTRFSSILRWVLGPSIAIGIWHILNLSVPLSEAWGLS